MQSSLPIPTQLPVSIPIDQAQKATRRETRFYWTYVFALLFAFIPSRELGQLSALVYVFLLIFVVQLRPNFHLGRFAVTGLALAFFAFLYLLIEPEIFDVFRYLLSILTFSAFFLLLFDFRLVANTNLIRRIRTATLWILVLQAGVGFTQAAVSFQRRGTFDSNSGDVIWGTLAPLYSAAYISTMPYYILLMSTLLLFCIATQPQRIGIVNLVAYGAIGLVWILASMMHSIVYFVFAVGFCVAVAGAVRILPRLLRNHKLDRRTFSQIFGLVMAVILISLATIRFLPGNVSMIPVVFERIEFSDTARSFKLRVAYATVMHLPHDVPHQPLIGVGPGQFNSRAALMTSGEYLGRPLPFIGVRVNELTREYILPYLGPILSLRGGSSMDFPSSSWIALYAEMGLLGLLGVGLLSVHAYRRFLLSARDAPAFPYMKLTLSILLTYLLLMGLQSVYWEYTQSVWPAIFVVKLCYDYLTRVRTEPQV